MIKIKLKTLKAAALTLLITNTSAALATEVIFNRPESEKDPRTLYQQTLLQAVLDRTAAEYGEAKIGYTESFLQRERALAELQKGNNIHVVAEATRPNFEENAIPVRIPILKGIMGYRVYLIDKNQQDSFSQAQDLDALKAIPHGLGAQWSITPVFKDAGFNVVTGNDYEGLFKMLTSGRFTAFSRGINEVFGELENRQGEFSDLSIENEIALHLPLPSYFFVSPKHPELAERIEKGLEMMIADGSFDRIFMEHNGELIKKANLQDRRIFSLTNPNLSAQTPLDRKDLWFDPTSL